MMRKWRLTVLAFMLALSLGFIPFTIDSAQAAFPAGTSAYWALDEDQQTTPGPFVEEINTPTANGACATGGCPTFAPGPPPAAQVNNAQTFNGVADGIDVADDPVNPSVFDWAPNASISIAVWVRRDPGAVINPAEVAIGRDETQSGAGNENLGIHWWLGINGNDGAGTNNVAAFVLSDSGAVPPAGAEGLLGATDIADGNWHYLVGVRDYANELILLYVDGVEVARKSVVQANYLNGFGSTRPMTMGYMDFRGGDVASAPDFFFTGDIDEVALFNKALTDVEVTQYFALGQAGDSLGSGVEPVFDSIVVGDLNGDGPEDLAGVSTSGEVYYSLNLIVLGENTRRGSEHRHRRF